MPEHLRSLLVILAIATVVFAFARAPASAMAMSAGDFARRRNLWFAVTLIAFLAHNFWVFIALTAVLLLFSLPKEKNRTAMLFFLLCAVPPMEVAISGLGLFDQLFTITYLRLLSLVILLPAFLSLRRQAGVEPFGSTTVDKFLLAYLVVFFVLLLRSNTLTNALRYGVLYGLLDTFLPYYVASRSLRNVQDFRDAFMAFVVGAMVMSGVAVFEYLKGWLLYTSLDEALGVPWWSNYLSRDDSVRAQGSLVQPIPLGYYVAVAAGLYLFLIKAVRHPVVWAAGFLVLMAGLYAPLSRGPWVGAAATILLFIAIGPEAVKRLAALGVLAICAIPPLLLTDAGEKLINKLPFIGNLETQNVVYRQRLLEISIEVISQKPFFGAFDYYVLPEMQELKQGQGIIDIVNTYLQVGLERGLVGLSLFTGIFMASAIGVWKSMRREPDRSGENFHLGQTLFASLAGVMITIFTVSSISVVPIIYWSLLGVCVAYIIMIARADLGGSSLATNLSGAVTPAQSARS